MKKKIAVHISFDDVIGLFGELKKEKFESVFQYRILKRLKWFHERYGCRFTLYVFIEFAGSHLCEIPYVYRKELLANADWLKWGYHGYSPEMRKEQFEKGYEIFENTLIKSLNKNCESHMVRLHAFCADREQIMFMKDNHINTFLTADDMRVSYDLSEEERNVLAQNGIYEKKEIGIRYIRTKIRLEKFVLRKCKNDLKGIENIPVVIFSHENFISKRFISKEFFKLWMIIKFLRRHYEMKYYN